MGDSLPIYVTLDEKNVVNIYKHDYSGSILHDYNIALNWLD